MTPEPVEALVERVRYDLDNFVSDSPALTELAERVKTAERFGHDMAALAKVEKGRAEAAERERDRLAKLNSGLTRDFNVMLVACSAAEAQRDELVEALDLLSDLSVEHDDERLDYITAQIDRADLDIARAALAKVRGEATCEKCKHPAHEPGACGVNVGTGYLGSVPCRCGVRGEAEPPGWGSDRRCPQC